jgi:hypothetical protein
MEIGNHVLHSIYFLCLAPLLDCDESPGLNENEFDDEAADLPASILDWVVVNCHMYRQLPHRR